MMVPYNLVPCDLDLTTHFGLFTAVGGLAVGALWDVLGRYLPNVNLHSAAALLNRSDDESADDEPPARRPADEVRAQAELAERSFQQCVKAGHLQAALAIYHKVPARSRTKYWHLPEGLLVDLIKGLHHEKKWSDSVPFMVDLLHAAPERTHNIRLKLAQILVQVEHRPRQAMQVLSVLPAQLPESIEKQRSSIWALAQRKVKEGAVEKPTEEW
ncbi:MAG: hypothetical protein R3E01_27880 [Pirellulaceae bacterium]|nr:hypothetical protein [Planctomycetales bacterium]